MTPNFEIVVGTYEQFLLGYKIDKIVNEYKMEQTFATHSHIASIRSVASGRHYLASGGADESICLYDMRYRTENGKLVHHNDSVNCVTFTPDASHILTGSSDGTIGVVRCGNWQVEKLWQKPHKGFAVEALAVHPSGKIALSTGGDGVLRTWNLVKGKSAYATNLVPRWKALAKNINILKWSPNGEKYLIASDTKIDVYSVETAGIDEEIQVDTKVICVEFLNDDLIAIGYDNGKISFYDLEEGSKTFEIQAHDARLKCMQHFDDLLVTASSSGEIKLWRFTKDSLTLLNRVTCNSRILCLTLASECKSLKYKKDEVEVEEDVPVKKVSKLRTKQEVIIEVEDEENAPVKKKQKKEKSANTQNSETVITPIEKKRKIPVKGDKSSDTQLNENGINLKKDKKRKTQMDGEESGNKVSKKKKTIAKEKKSSRAETEDDEEQEAEINLPKKKKTLMKGKKFSKIEVEEDEEETENDLPKKKKTLMNEKRDKKRKTATEEDESSPKKKKAVSRAIKNGKTSLKKKKTNKTVK